MVTNNITVVCPKCKAINSYNYIHMKLYDNDLHITYSCEACGSDYTNIYTLVYLGGYANGFEYDRDNLISR